MIIQSNSILHWAEECVLILTMATERYDSVIMLTIPYHTVCQSAIVAPMFHGFCSRDYFWQTAASRDLPFWNGISFEIINLYPTR